MTSNADAYERFLIERIEQIKQRAEHDAAPYVEKLTILRSLLNPSPVVIAMEELRPFISNNLVKIVPKQAEPDTADRMTVTIK